MADMQDLGSCAERRGGSSPFDRTITGVLIGSEILGGTLVLYVAALYGV